MLRILIATDGAAHSDTAVRLGSALARETAVAVTLLTVVKDKTRRPAAEATLAHAANLLALPAETIFYEGRPDEEIVRAAQAGGYDLLVLGMRPTRDFAARFIGPVAERVITRAPCPVIIAKQEMTRLRRVLLCEGGRSPSLLQRLTTRLGPLFAATDVTVLHVMSQITAAPGVPDWQLQASAAELMAQQTPEGQLLARDVRLLRRSALATSHAKVRYGLVVDEILAEAHCDDYDLVVIGAHEAAGWERFLLDNLAHQIVAQVQRPILVV